MTRTSYIALFILGLLISLGVSFFEAGPGYMDADYYFGNGLRIASGHGWSEPFSWNYLNEVGRLPRPAFTYWMPLAAVIAALGEKISGWINFSGARLGFLFLAGFIPPLTARLAYSFTFKRWSGILAGVLAAFSGFYLPYLPTTDTFGISMVLGGLFFLVLSKLNSGFDNRSAPWLYYTIIFALGLLSGLLHLNRADGILWLFIALGFLLIRNQFRRGGARGVLPIRTELPRPALAHHSKSTSGSSRFLSLMGQCGVCFAGYLLVSGTWYGRNLLEFGTLFAPGSSRTLWLTRYDELFAYPATTLTFQHWLSSGILEILTARGWALGQNLQTVLAVQGAIFLTPLMLIGLWKTRANSIVRIGIFAWAIIFFVMTLVFPFQGARGGFFHSGAVIQPLLWAAVPVGLESFIQWGRLRRGWEVAQAMPVFAIGLAVIALLLSVFLSWQRVIGSGTEKPVWGASYRAYAQLEQKLQEIGITEESIVMVGNPPGYFVTTGRSAIVIPYGDLKATLAAGERFGVDYLLLDENSPKGLNYLYLEPGNSPGLRYLSTVEDVHIFEFK